MKEMLIRVGDMKEMLIRVAGRLSDPDIAFSPGSFWFGWFCAMLIAFIVFSLARSRR